jgi:magnesium transporter
MLRKVLIPHRRIFGNINGHYSFFVNEENRPYYLDLVVHLDSILDTAKTLTGSGEQLHRNLLLDNNRPNSEIITVSDVSLYLSS